MSVVVVRSKYYCIPVLLSMSVVVVRSKYYFGDARVYVLALSVDVLWAEESLQGSAHEVANCAVLLVFCPRGARADGRVDRGNRARPETGLAPVLLPHHDGLPLHVQDGVDSQNLHRPRGQVRLILTNIIKKK